MNKKTLAARAAMGAAMALSLEAGLFSAARAEAVDARLAAPVAGAPASFADLVQRVAPAVVSIDVEGKKAPVPAMFSTPGPQGPDGGQDQQLPFGFQQFFGPGLTPIPQAPQKMEASGSGFFISPDGYVLTNNHVVDGADKITVRTDDGQSLPARVIGRDADTDLAVVKVEVKDHAYVSFENQARPRVGDWVVAVGNPFDLGGTATAGIVSALSRPDVSGSSYVDYMQIDAPINHGNSGGPTFDVYGRVVGVNSAIFSPSGGSVGIGFDIPADVAQSVSKQLIAYGKVTRGFIGATIQNVTPDVADSLGAKDLHGALVAEVRPDGPSAGAGLKSGDVITAVDGEPVTSASGLTRRVALAHPGDVLRLKVLRDGVAREVDVRSGLRPDQMALAENNHASDAGAGVLGMQLQSDPQGGVTIAGVSAGSDAGEKGLQSGDRIVRAGERPVNAPDDVAAAVGDAQREGRKAVLLLVEHGGQQLFVALDVPQQKS